VRRRRGAAAAVLLVCAGCATAPPPPRPGRQCEVRFETAGPALVYLPEEYDRSSARWPLILFLHGAGERGADLALVKREGLPRMLERLSRFPFVVVSPQCPPGKNWSVEDLMHLLDDVEGRYRVDPGRTIVTGLSSGAVASLELAILHPGRFAAVVAVAPHRIPPDLCGMRDVPLALYQNAGDDRVPVALSRRLAGELEKCGGRVVLTIYPAEGHDAWTDAYADGRLYDWLLSLPPRRL
jgi:predicted peptidase